MAYLFLHGPEKHWRPPSNRKRRSFRQAQQIETADSFVVEIFAELQRLWRRQGRLRRTFDGMPTSQQECEGWKRLIRHLGKATAPQGLLENRAVTTSEPATAAYRRGDLFNKRRRLMNEWAKFGGSRPSDAANNVVSLQKPAGG
jgi:hypothetical protein